MFSSFRVSSKISFVLYIFIAFVLFKYLEDRTCVFLSYDDKFFRRLLRYSRIALVCLYFYCEYKNGFDKKRLLKSSFFIVIFLCSSYFSKSWAWVLFDLLFIPVLFSNYVSFNKVVTVSFFCFSAGTLLTILFNYLNIIPDVPFSRHGSVRYPLGFSHPNNLGLFLMLISITSVFLCKKFSWYIYLLISILTVFCILVPKSYTPAYIMIMLLVGLPIVCKYERKGLSDSVKRNLFNVFIFAFVILVVSIYLIAIFGIGENIIRSLPGALWARFSSGYRALSEYGISILGQQVTLSKALFETNHNALILDCSYFFMPIVLGVIPTLLYFYLLFVSVKHSIYSLNLRLFFVQCLALFYGISETMIFSPYFIFLFLGASASILNNPDNYQED